jgi:hypothetical protein
MNDELSGKLTEILGAMQTAVGQAKDFTLAQLPDVVQSYVIYGRVWSLVCIALAIGFMGVALAVSRWAYKNPWKGDFGEERGFSNALIIILGVVGTGGGLFFAIASIKNSLLVWFAPKVWLLMRLGELVSDK